MLVNYSNLNKIKEEEFTSIQEGYKNVWPWGRKVDSPIRDQVNGQHMIIVRSRTGHCFPPVTITTIKIMTPTQILQLHTLAQAILVLY